MVDAGGSRSSSRAMRATSCAVLCAVALAGCGGGGSYWDQGKEFGDKPMFDNNGDKLKQRISAALHTELKKCGADESDVANRISRGDLRSGSGGFYIVDTGKKGVSPDAVRSGDVPGWLITSPNPAPVTHPSKVEVHCKHLSQVPDFLRTG